MREHPGLRDDQTTVDNDGFSTLQNVSFDVAGEIKRRPGLGGRISQSGILVAEHRHPIAGAYYIFISETGTIESVVKS